MHLKTHFFCTLLLFSISCTLHAQLIENYFYDTEQKEEGSIHTHFKGDDYIIVAGKTYDKFLGQPFVAKVDTQGNVIWNTTSQDTSVYQDSWYRPHGIINIELFDNYIYALFFSRVSGSNYLKEIWKVEFESGDIVWKKPFETHAYKVPQNIINYDANTLLIDYIEDYNGSVYTTRMAFIEKSTGDFASTHALNEHAWQTDSYGFGIDTQKDIYYTKHDSIFKLSGTNPENIIWAISHPEITSTYQRIYFDENDDLYLFTSQNDGKMVSIDKQNGDLIWHTTLSSKRLSDFKDKDGFIYATYQHTLVGGSPDNTSLIKLEKSTGLIEWQLYHPFLGSTAEQAALSLDVNNNGDIFLTGYYDDANYGPGKWSVLKVGSTGTVLFEQTIELEGLPNDELSQGVAACVINDKLYLVGDLETSNLEYHPRTKITFVELDKETGDLIQMKHIGGTFQYPSKTLQIENYQTDKTVVFKEVGRAIVIEMYDVNQDLLWEKSFIRNYILKGIDLTISENGTIIFNAYKSFNYILDQLYSVELLFFKLDASGNLIEEFTIPDVINQNFLPLEILSDINDEIFFFYSQYQDIYYRQIGANGVSNAQQIGLLTFEPLYYTQRSVKTSENKILYINRKNIYEIVSNTQESNFLIEVPLSVNHVQMVENENIILCGFGTYTDKLAKINSTSLDTLWTQTYDTTSLMDRFITNQNHSHIFSIGRYNNQVVVRKVDAMNGQSVWSTLYDCPLGEKDIPLDLSYNPTNEHLTVTGYAENEENQDLFIILLNKHGDIIDSYQPNNLSLGENIGLCTTFLPNGSTWIGGQVTHNDWGESGFIFELEAEDPLSSIEALHTSNKETEQIHIYPNPNNGVFYIDLNLTTENNTISISIYDLSGKQLQSIHNTHVSSGQFKQELSLSQNTQNMMFLQIIVNNEISEYTILIN